MRVVLAAVVLAADLALTCAAALGCSESLTLYSWPGTFDDSNADGQLDPGCR